LFYYGQVTVVNTLNIGDMLEGETKFYDWKARVIHLLEENDLKEYVEHVVAIRTDLQELESHKKKEVKDDQLTSISVTIEEVDLVNVSLIGLPGYWEPFV
jgi:hypothetical protein